MINPLDDCKEYKSIVPFLKFGDCIKSIFHILVVVVIAIVISPIAISIMI